MPILTKKLETAGRQISCLVLSRDQYEIEVLPEQGFSIISFKHDNNELLDQWNLEEFVGTDEDLSKVAVKGPNIFRKGFGPHIGPWFGKQTPDSEAWQHGVCRFADWRENLETGDDFVRSRIDGGVHEILGQKLDHICGFHVDVEMEYRLSGDGLAFTIRNQSADQQGVFGIHWYFQNPKGTRVMLLAKDHRITADGEITPLDDSVFTVLGDEVTADMDREFACILENIVTAGGTIKTQLSYAQGRGLTFEYDPVFRFTTLFTTGNSLCVEPVSGIPYKQSRFGSGTIRIGVS